MYRSSPTLRYRINTKECTDMHNVKSILFLLFLLLPCFLSAQSINEIKKEKEKSEKQISYLNKLLEDAKNDKSVSVEKLNILRRKIAESKKLLNSLSKEVNYLEGRISQNETRIVELTQNKQSMLDLYSKLIYGTWKKRNRMNKLMFIFSSSDFNQAYSRYKYFEQIQEYSKRQMHIIGQVNDSLNMRNGEMKKYIEQKNNTVNEINGKNRELVVQQNNESSYIKQLETKEGEITRKLKQENKNRERLARELDRLIAAQTKKSGGGGSSATYKLTPEQKLVSADFVKNRGKLPWPVAEGFISERFGINAHPVYKRVQITNDGVNITTSKNADVRAVFNGEVTEILFMPGFNNVVIIQHGDYYTVYTNLLDVSVKKGDKIKVKEFIGKVAYDNEKGSSLNFQVWKGIEKLDPQLWLAK